MMVKVSKMDQEKGDFLLAKAWHASMAVVRSRMRRR